MHEHEMQKLKRNRSVFDRKWKAYIKRELNGWSKGGVSVRKSAREEIWMAYYAFNEHCAENYLVTGTEKLDRYQVAACFLCGILAARPLTVERLSIDDARRNANEFAAIHVACSILAGFTLEAIDESDLCVQDKEAASAHVRDGLNFDNAFPTGHETYLLSVVKCLRFTAAERRYNLLFASLLMYHWEMALVGDRRLYEALVAGKATVPVDGDARAAALQTMVPPTSGTPLADPVEASATVNQALEAQFGAIQDDESLPDPSFPEKKRPADEPSMEMATIEAPPVESDEGNPSSSAVAESTDGGRAPSVASEGSPEKGADASSNAKAAPTTPTSERAISDKLSQHGTIRKRRKV